MHLKAGVVSANYIWLKNIITNNLVFSSLLKTLSNLILKRISTF